MVGLNGFGFCNPYKFVFLTWVSEISIWCTVEFVEHCWLDIGLQFWHQTNSIVKLNLVVLMISRFYTVIKICKFFYDSVMLSSLITDDTHSTLRESQNWTITEVHSRNVPCIELTIHSIDEFMLVFEICLGWNRLIQLPSLLI